jgi:fibronectin type 3 domain-containing protein
MTIGTQAGRITLGAAVVLVASCAPAPYPGTEHTPATPVDAPASVSASAGHYQTTLTWSTDAGLAYNIYWGTSSSITKTTANRVGGVAAPFVHSGLENGITYHYIVTAVQGDQESVASSEVTAMPLPPAPTGVSVEAGDGEVTVSWSPVSTADSYYVYWSNSSTFTAATGNKLTATVGSQSKTISDEVDNNVTYYFAVSVAENGVEGPLSAKIGATPNVAVADIPGGVTATQAAAGLQSLGPMWRERPATTYIGAPPPG